MSSSREKNALIALAMLVIVFVCIGVSYVTNAGKTWNLAASVMDDTLGSMEGYSVIVYEGTVEPEPEEELPVLDASETELEEAEAEESVQSPIDSAVELAESYEPTFLPLEEYKEPAERIYVSDVRTEYESKGASVLSLDSHAPWKYSQPGFYYVSDKLVGVLSIESPLPATRMAEYSKFFNEAGTEVVMCITPRRAYLETLEGVDIVLVTGDDEGYTTIGSNEDDTFVVRAPENGTIGVILITSSNVVSSKAISELQ